MVLLSLQQETITRLIKEMASTTITLAEGVVDSVAHEEVAPQTPVMAAQAKCKMAFAIAVALIKTIAEAEAGEASKATSKIATEETTTKIVTLVVVAALASIKTAVVGASAAMVAQEATMGTSAVAQVEVEAEEEACVGACSEAVLGAPVEAPGVASTGRRHSHSSSLKPCC